LTRQNRGVLADIDLIELGKNPVYRSVAATEFPRDLWCRQALGAPCCDLVELILGEMRLAEAEARIEIAS
jgi:hypothetical protein